MNTTNKLDKVTTVPIDEEDMKGDDTVNHEKDKLNTESDKKKKDEKESVPNLGGLRRLRSEFGKGCTIYAIIGGTAAFLNGGIMPLFAVIFAEILDILADSIDESGNSHFARDSMKALLYFVGMGTGALVFNLTQYWFFGIYGSKISTRVRQVYFDRLTEQEIGYHEIETSSKLNARLTTECFAIQEALGTKYAFFIQTIAQFIIGIAVAFIYSWRLTLVLFATMPALIFVGMVQGTLMKNMSGSGGGEADPFVHAGSFSQEVLTNIRTVLAFPTLVTSKLQEYSELIDIARPVATKKLVYIGVGLGGFMGCMFAVCYSVGLYTGAVFVDEGHITVSQLFGAYFAFMMGGMGLGQLGSVQSDIKNGHLGANKFFQLYERKPKIKKSDKGDAILLNDKDELDGSIELLNVRFAYPTAPNNEVLKGISVSIESGKTLAIVGPSGSGKSTIIGLLERYYDPKGGEIRIGGELIHDYDVSSLRKHIGLVSQMPLLFDATIKENILGGDETATEEEIFRAAKLANAHDFILTLPNGYDTQVGELGGRLSGGQRQRVCIARAILKIPSILLLDEATSALDTKSEKEVQDALDQITNELNLTTVVIAHRLSTIKDADKIMVLVDGDIEEVGTHNELIDMNGVYSALVASQQLVDTKKEHHMASKQEYLQSQSDVLSEYNSYNNNINNTNNNNNRISDNNIGESGLS